MTSKSRTALLVLWAIAYVGLGCLTEFRLAQEKPIPESLMSDFVVYREALNRALEGGDPYVVRYIGPGFFYPPPALLVVGLLASVGRLGFRAMFATHFLVTLALMGIMVWGLSRYYGLRGKAAWYWWVLALGSAPLMEVIHLGQINVLTEFGIFLLFVAEGGKPVLSGAGLALAAITKVVPIVFTGYLALRRRLREILAAGLALTAATALAYASYGPSALSLFPKRFSNSARRPREECRLCR